ncbi:SDR family oxidoreductase [Nocardia sp. NPDC057227]|uniref:SDR family oxidoreductase n=1 Tax=Nocardia sp. NPDC057227 TaxID=3346056 RepID=UPI00362C0FBF
MTAVLLTGAGGLVGAEVAARLHRRGRHVVALTHRTPGIVDCAGNRLPATAFADDPEAPVTAVRGDVRAPGFGLDASAMSGRVGAIVHCAATTDFAAPQRDYDELNVAGTANACALALELDVPLVYVSTAYVCGRREGVIAEDDLGDAHGFGNGYERSKFDAETHVRNTEGLRWSIVRPGIVTGYTGSGAIRDYKNLYTVVKLIVEGKLRTLPGRYDATLSLAPVDFVADTVVAAVTDFTERRTFHAVGADPLSLRGMSEVLAEYPSFEVARFVPKSAFVLADLGDLEREYYLRIGAQYTGYFDARRSFDTANTAALLGTPAPDTGPAYLRTLLDFCTETGYLGAPLASVDEVVRCSS